MTYASATRIAAAAFGGLALVGLTTAARADMLFHNLTGQTLHFSISCDGTGSDQWSIYPNDTGKLVCNNGSQAARVVIRTDHGPYDEVVRATVHDGGAYNLGYDRDGDVSIAPRG
jgi:hypothetical protein